MNGVRGRLGPGVAVKAGRESDRGGQVESLVAGGVRGPGQAETGDRGGPWTSDQGVQRQAIGQKGGGDWEGPGRVVGAGRERRSVHAGEATRGASVGCRQRRRWRQRSGRRERGRGSAGQGRGERQDGVRVYCCPSGVVGAES